MDEKHIRVAPRVHIKVRPDEPKKYSLEDLLRQEDKALPYVEDKDQPIGKLINLAIAQELYLLKKSKKKRTIIML